jgi:hypothetical protein
MAGVWNTGYWNTGYWADGYWGTSSFTPARALRTIEVTLEILPRVSMAVQFPGVVCEEQGSVVQMEVQL